VVKKEHVTDPYSTSKPSRVEMILLQNHSESLSFKMPAGAGVYEILVVNLEAVNGNSSEDPGSVAS
jgi:hypothetical protein